VKLTCTCTVGLFTMSTIKTERDFFFLKLARMNKQYAQQQRKMLPGEKVVFPICAMDTEMLSRRNVQEGIYWWDVPHMTLKLHVFYDCSVAVCMCSYDWSVAGSN